MNEIKEARMRFVLILIAVSVVTLIVLWLCMRGKTPTGPAEEAKAETAVAEKQTSASAPAPQPAARFRKAITASNFGAPLDFSKARHGELSMQECPGSAGVATGIIVDMDTRKVIWEKGAEKQVKIASMTKMMTLLVAMEELEKRPDVNFDTQIAISPEVMKIRRTGVIYLDPKETLPLSDLMKAACIKSANDASTMIAIYFGGSLDAFVKKMNDRAQELGLTKTHFVNACGLPEVKTESRPVPATKKKGKGKKAQAQTQKVVVEKNHCVSTAREMVLLGERLLEYPQLMEWLGMQSSKLKADLKGQERTVVSTNKLVNPRWPGVDGLKTGYYAEAGFCLTFSVLRDGRRFIGCVTGSKTPPERDRFCRKLIDWAYKQQLK